MPKPTAETTETPISAEHAKLIEESKMKGELIELLSQEVDRLKEELETQAVQVVMVPMNAMPKKVEFNDLKCYIVKLSQPTHFNDSPDIVFDRMVLLCRREFEREFHFSDLPLYLPEDQIDVVGQAASAWLIRISWLPDSVPLMLVTYTERDVEEFLDAVIDANAIKELKIKVLERMHYNMLNAFSKYGLKIDQAEAFEEKAKVQEVQLRKKINTELVRMDNATNERFDKVAPRLSMRKLIMLGMGWVAFAITLTAWLAKGGA